MAFTVSDFEKINRYSDVFNEVESYLHITQQMDASLVDPDSIAAILNELPQCRRNIGNTINGLQITPNPDGGLKVSTLGAEDKLLHTNMLLSDFIEKLNELSVSTPAAGKKEIDAAIEALSTLKDDYAEHPEIFQHMVDFYKDPITKRTFNAPYIAANMFKDSTGVELEVARTVFPSNLVVKGEDGLMHPFDAYDFVRECSFTPSHDQHMTDRWYAYMKDKAGLERVKNSFGNVTIPGSIITSNDFSEKLQAIGKEKLFSVALTGYEDLLPIVIQELFAQQQKGISPKNIDLDNWVRNYAQEKLNQHFRNKTNGIETKKEQDPYVSESMSPHFLENQVPFFRNDRKTNILKTAVYEASIGKTLPPSVLEVFAKSVSLKTSSMNLAY